MTFKLLESSPRKHRTPTEAAFSIAVHTVLIAAFVYATAQSGDVMMTPAQNAQSVTFAIPKAAPKAPAPAPKPRVRPPTAEASTAPPVAVEEASASDLAGDATGERSAYYDFEVGMAAAALGGGMRPRYPDALRHQGVEGRVEVEFVVDENGRVDMETVKVIESSHPLFTSAVRNALRGMRFSPAKMNGIPVRQFVRLPVVFQLRS